MKEYKSISEICLEESKKEYDGDLLGSVAIHLAFMEEFHEKLEELHEKEVDYLKMKLVRMEIESNILRRDYYNLIEKSINKK